MSDYSMKNFGDPRVVRDFEVPPENLSHSPSTSLLDELERNRARIGATQQDENARMAERARLAAEQQAIIRRQAGQVQGKTPMNRLMDFDALLEEREKLANKELSGFLDSFEK